MTLQTVPYALQNAAHSAAVFRQSASAPWQTPGVLGNTELQVTAQTTPNMSVLVNYGRAKVAGTAIATPGTDVDFTTQAMYDVLNDAPVTVTVAAASAVNPRIDAVYTQVQDSFYGDAADQAVLGIVQGVAAAVPVAPAIPDNAELLAYVAVGANATSIVTGNISDKRIQAVLLPGKTVQAYQPRVGSTTDKFGSGTMTNLVNGTLVGAPAGTYHLFGNVIVAASAATTGYLRLQAGGYGPPDTYLSIGTDYDEYALESIFNWPGGDLAFIYDLQLTAGTGTVRANGSYVGLIRLGE